MYNVLLREQTSSLPHIIRRRDLTYTVSGACDCACSTVAIPRTVPDVSKNQAFHVPLSFHTLPLHNEYQVAYVPSGNGKGDGIAVLNPSALEMLLALHQEQVSAPLLFGWEKKWGKEIVDTAIQDFLQLGFLTGHSEASTRDTTQITNDMLSVWLHITDRCNLRCSYCYLPHRSVDMSLEVGKASLEATFRSAKIHEFRQVKIKYAGGEPLLRFSFVQELHRYAQQLAERNDIMLDGIVLSNGTLLTPEIVRSLKASGLRLMISLDHLPHSENVNIHDISQRCYPDGRSSAVGAAQAVKLALESDLIPDMSITVSGQNIQDIPELVKWVLERDLPFGLNFYREHERCSSCHDLRLEETAIIEGMRSAYQIIEENLPRRSLLASLIDRANLAVPHTHTCGVGRHYLVFDTEGNVSKCQMQIEQPITSVHDHDPLGRIQESQVGIQNISVDQKNECFSCEWKYWCAGGCPLAAYRATGRYDAKSPYCNIYRALYPEVIRLEGLRLLQTHGNRQS